MNQNLQQLRDLGQSLWLDNITRDLLDSGTLKRYLDEYGLTGLTSNPTIFNEAIGGSGAYDAGIRDKRTAGLDHEALFTELALEDLRRAADLFRPAHEATDGIDGWAPGDPDRKKVHHIKKAAIMAFLVNFMGK